MKRKLVPAVVGHDNRGTEDAPFGFVYFDDGLRVGYAPGTAKSLFDSGATSPLHHRLAHDYLKACGIDTQLAEARLAAEW